MGRSQMMIASEMTVSVYSSREQSSALPTILLPVCQIRTTANEAQDMLKRCRTVRGAVVLHGLAWPCRSKGTRGGIKGLNETASAA